MRSNFIYEWKDTVMKKRTLHLTILLSTLCLGLLTTAQLKGAGYGRMFSDVPSKTSVDQNDLVVAAHVNIQHNYRGDLVADLGVGDPDRPDWSINVWNREDGEAENLNLTIDISEANQHLPPSESSRWFLKVYDAATENVGQIAEFNIRYHGQTYASTCIPVHIQDLQTSFSYIPDVPVELAISRRMSIRDFPETENYTLPEVSWELLSKVLWASYGSSSWGRTVPNICGNYPIIIYVCNKTAVYKYNPEEQSLDLWREGDRRFSTVLGDYPGPGVHRAPIELFIILDTNKSDDLYLGAMEAGCIIQNIYLEANSLGLGTVCVGGVNGEAVHNVLDLPANEHVLYNMPLGHPQSWAFYNFTFVDPESSSASYPWFPLPQVEQSSVFLDYALLERKTAHDLEDTPLTQQETSQILWSAYGRCYLKDMRPSFWSFQYRHRTVPSAGGGYPLQIWMADSTGVYYYDFWKHRIRLLIEGDRRLEVATAAGANWTASAPTMLLLVLNSSKMNRGRLDWAYTETGFVIQNVHLESVAWGLVTDWVNVVDEDALKSVLGIVEHPDLHPITVITVGHPSTYRHKVLWNGIDYTISVSTNSTVTNFAFNQPAKTESFEIAGTNGTRGFCNATIPKELLNGDFSVLIDDSPVSFTITQNTTHSFLRFNYTHTVHKIRIVGTSVIPESIHLLPSFVVFILATTVVIHQHRRRGKNLQKHERTN